MDVHTPKQRSYNMSQIKGKNTKPEMIVRKWLWKQGFRYRLHRKDLPGKPDIVFPGRKKIIFIHGCFWHRHDCKYFKWPKNNEGFWKEKIEGNINRDTKNYELLKIDGWDILTIWECEIRDHCPEITNKIRHFLSIYPEIIDRQELLVAENLTHFNPGKSVIKGEDNP